MAFGSKRLIDQRIVHHNWDGKGTPFLQDIKMFVEKCAEVGIPNNTRVRIGEGFFRAESSVEVQPMLVPVESAVNEASYTPDAEAQS